MRNLTTADLFVATMFVDHGSHAAANIIVGGQRMLAGQTMVENIARSPDHSLLLDAIKGTGLVDMLHSAGPYTLFAPTNAAFGKLPPGVFELLFDPQHIDMLRQMLLHHLLPGSHNFNTLETTIRSQGGKAVLASLDGSQLALVMNGQRNMLVLDARQNIAGISVYDVVQANGVIHVIDTVLLPS